MQGTMTSHSLTRCEHSSCILQTADLQGPPIWGETCPPHHAPSDRGDLKQCRRWEALSSRPSTASFWRSNSCLACCRAQGFHVMLCSRCGSGHKRWLRIPVCLWHTQIRFEGFKFATAVSLARMQEDDRAESLVAAAALLAW